MEILSILPQYSNQPLSSQVLLGLLKEYNRPYDKIVEMQQQGYLTQLRKGLYITTNKVSTELPHPFLIANHLYGPSYISLDAALFHWGFIPERVYEITSVTTKISKTFSCQGINYSFTHLPAAYYPIGIQTLSITNSQYVLIASPEKSICDKIITTSGIHLRSKKQCMEYLVDDLRIDKENLRQLKIKEIVNLLSVCPKKSSIKVLVEAIESL